MADIDVDKILEQSEKAEEKQLKEGLIKKLAIGGGAVGVAAIIALIIILVSLGERSAKYFPLEPGFKYVYNKKGKSPEEWKVLSKKTDIGGYSCSMINRIDQGNFSSKQEYYYTGKEGVIRVAYSKNFGSKKESQLVVLPPRIKKGAKFSGGTIRGTEIEGVIQDREILNTFLGEVEALKVSYSGGKYVNKTVWYAEGVGLVKEEDRANRGEMGLISLEKE